MTDNNNKTIGLDKITFFCGKGMQRNWIEMNVKLLDYVGSKYGQSAKVSLEVGEMVVTEVDESLLPKFKTEAEKDEHLKKLEYWEQEAYLRAKEDCHKYSRTIRKDLSSVHGIVYSLCDISVRNRLEAETEYKDMIKKKRHDAIVLHKLLKRI